MAILLSPDISLLFVSSAYLDSAATLLLSPDVSTLSCLNMVVRVLGCPALCCFSVVWLAPLASLLNLSCKFAYGL